MLSAGAGRAIALDPAPRQQHQVAIRMQRQHCAGRRHRRSCTQVIGALVAVQVAQQGFERVFLWLRCGGCAEIHGRAWVGAGAAGIPQERRVAIEVDADLVRGRRWVGATAQRVVQILALQVRRVAAFFDLHAAIGVGDRHDPHLSAVEQRGHIGVAAVVVDQIVHPAPGHLTRRQLAGVNRGHQEEARLIGVGTQGAILRSAMCDANGLQVVTARLRVHLQPTVAVIDHFGEVGMRGGDGVQVRLVLSDGAVTLEEGLSLEV